MGICLCIFCIIKIYLKSLRLRERLSSHLLKIGRRRSRTKTETIPRRGPPSGWLNTNGKEREGGDSHKTQPVPCIYLPPSHSWAGHFAGGGLEDEVLWLILLFLLWGGSEQPLFGCLFLLQEHTYAQCGSQSHPVCFLTTSCSRLWQKANRWVDLNFLVMQHDTEASCLPEHVLEKHFNWIHAFPQHFLTTFECTSCWEYILRHFYWRSVLWWSYLPLLEYTQTLKAFIWSS